MSALQESVSTCQTQRTLKRNISYKGIGIHTGTQVTMTFYPAEKGSGITFKRIDLPGQPEIPASLDFVCDTSRSTTIGKGDVLIHTVEHVLAAIRAYQINNLCIEISSIEPPIANGSSDVFVEMIEDAGVEEQDAIMPVLSVKEPVYYSDADIHLVALPYEGYKISYTLCYPNSKILKSQYFSLDITPDSFKNEIASCRTFSEYHEISALIDHGLIKGGSLDNAVIIKDDVVFSKEGLYFPDEMVRHKILDVIGDLALIGSHFNAHIIAIRSGHKSNIAFAKKIYNVLKAEQI